jgi:murein DD-endopeptidase MepM/ murein hydrolase activator NlpD
MVTVGGFNFTRADNIVTTGTKMAVAPAPSPDTKSVRAKALQQRAAAAAAARASRQRAASAATELARRQAAERARLERERARLEQQRKEAAREAAERAARERELRRWVAPVSNYRLSSYFGQAGGMWSSGRHTGQDFAAPYGTSIRAAHRGKIVFAGWDGSYGRKIVIEHEDGTRTWYCHLSSFTRTTGYVTTGELIGRVGSTGNSTGPHLHLEVHVDGVAVNPMTFLRRHGVDI